MGNTGCFPRGKPAATELRYPTYFALWVFFFLCCHNPPNSGMDYRIFNVRTDVNECGCTRGCRDSVRICTESWLMEKNPLPHLGIKPASAACRSDALPTDLHTHPNWTEIIAYIPLIQAWEWVTFIYWIVKLHSARRCSENNSHHNTC